MVGLLPNFPSLVSFLYSVLLPVAPSEDGQPLFLHFSVAGITFSLVDLV